MWWFGVRSLAGLLWLALGIAALSAPQAYAQATRRIFIVQSQEQGHVCGEPQAEGILNALAEGGWRQGVNLEARFH